MDEPSSGLDPVGRRELRALLTQLKNEGKTIFLSSHLLAEMESVCDRVGVLTQGKLVACGSPAEITRVRDQVAVQIAQGEQDEVLARAVHHWGGHVEAANGNAVGPRCWSRPRRCTRCWGCWRRGGRRCWPSRRGGRRWKRPS